MPHPPHAITAGVLMLLSPWGCRRCCHHGDIDSPGTGGDADDAVRVWLLMFVSSDLSELLAGDEDPQMTLLCPHKVGNISNPF